MEEYLYNLLFLEKNIPIGYVLAFNKLNSRKHV